MKWEPIDVIRLTALIGGFLLCGLGAWLMWLGVGAEGTVDIKSSVLSGTVKSGSAGLFIIFFGFAIVLFVLATLSVKSGSATLPSEKQRSRAHGVGVAFFVLVALTAVSGALAAVGLGAGFGGVALFSGAMALFCGLAYMELSS